ncbi:MAG TPA: glycosyltransferase family 39 protein [Candidatus Limnocylindrales bacterium]|nr:glycosyltransferase family 39 protein [Candidatus Limnocylindrales bacterium]
MLASLQELAREASNRIVMLGVVLGFFAIMAVIAARTNTPTPDEFVYVPAGYYHLTTGDLTFDTTNPPLLKMLMAAPLLAMDVRIDTSPKARDNSTGWGAWIFGTSFMELNRERYLDAFFRARLVIVALGLVLGVLVFARARELLSPAGALAALLVYGTMPPVIAHASVATLDVGVSLALFAALIAAARFARSKAVVWALATGAAFGFGFAIKGTAALFAPLVPILVAAEWDDWNADGIRRFVIGGASMLAAAWLAILVSYRFSGFPLPAPLVEGIRFQIAASSSGEFPAFLFGSWSQKGWWYYYLVALVLKTPIASLVLFVAGIVAIATGQGRPGDAAGSRRAEAAWILIPPLFLLYVLSFHYAKDYGIRYLLPAFPFLVLLAGRGADLLLRSGTYARAALAVLLVWQTAACAFAGPHQLAYFNELAGGPDRARTLLLDSNLDWGQDLGRLAYYLHDRGLRSACIGYFGHVSPKVYDLDFTLPPTTPAPGLCAISANFLAGYPYAITYAGDRIRGVRPGAWSWFDKLVPIARIGRSIYVYDVTAEDVARLGGSHPPAASPPAR